MDRRTTAQDVYRCELCDENMVDMLCVVCPRKLCKSCVGNHLDDDPNKHKLVKFQDRNTTLVLPTCPTHSSERCKNYCQECDNAVCPSCIPSDSHKKHTFLKISEVFEKRKENINSDTKELDEIVFPSYTTIVQKEESDAAKLEEDYKSLKQSIENQRKKWHDEIDKIVNMLQDETERMRETQLKALKKHIQKVKDLCIEIQEAIKSNKDILHSPNVTETLSYKSRNSALKRLPEKLELSTPKFIFQPINKDLIAKMFGVVLGFSISEHTEGYEKNTQTIRENEAIILVKPEIQFVLETGEIKCPDKIACQSNGKLWIAGNEGSLKLFRCDTLQPKTGATSSGLKLKHVNLNKGPTDIAVTRTGDLIYGIKLENTVFKLTKDKAQVLINLHDWKLLSLCITAFGELLVCMTDERKYRCRVVRFNQDPEIMQIIQYDHRGESLYTSGMLSKYIEENKNGDICLADCDAAGVIVTDRAGQFRFRYDGKTSFQNNAPFRPVGIATDSKAHILVSDSLKIHIIEENGQFLRFLDMVCSNPLRLALDEDDNLYISDTHGNVKVVRYTNTNAIFAQAQRLIMTLF